LKKVYDLTKKYDCQFVTGEENIGQGRKGFLDAFENDLNKHGFLPDVVTVSEFIS
jgi:4-aminobutyrate aminotransferase-like enzyme